MEDITAAISFPIIEFYPLKTAPLLDYHCGIDAPDDPKSPPAQPQGLQPAALKSLSLYRRRLPDEIHLLLSQ
jgi:hypothetical protein